MENIRNIWAVGRNYSEHAKELGNDIPTSPMIFLKAGTCVTASKEEITLPPWAQTIHYETEIALQLNEKLEFHKVGIALDLTERDIQSELKKNGHPWTLAKSFRGSLPLGPMVPISQLGAIESLRFHSYLNGQLKQSGGVQNMIFSPEKLRHFIIQHFPVVPGDLLITGTPAGVGPLRPGDNIKVILNEKYEVEFNVRKP